MHSSQHHEPMDGGPEQFYDPNNQMGIDPNANKTHTRFPDPAQGRFGTQDGKRPGSVGNRERKPGKGAPGMRGRSKM